MIKLKDLLNELDFGKFPFTDPDAANLDMMKQMSLQRLIDKYKYVTEPNTKDEQSLLKDISKYFEDESNTIQASELKALLAIKSKFPGILDPQSNDEYNSIYRGTSIPIKEILKYEWIKYPSQYSGFVYECKSPVAITSKGTRGFSSFSVFEDTAADFAGSKFAPNWEQNEESYENNVVPVVTSIYSSNPNALFNPDFSKLFNIHGNEGEVLYIGNSYKSVKTTLMYVADVLEKADETLSTEWIALAKHLKIEL